MLGMKTTVKGDKELVKKYKRAGKRVPRTVGMSMRKALYLVQNSMKLHLSGGSPLNVRSGRLRGSIRHEMRKRGIHLEGSVGSNLIYAPVHEFGAEIHTKSAAGMRFMVGGHWVTAQKVTIPKRPYAEPALTSNRERINQIFGRDMSNALRREGLL